MKANAKKPHGAVEVCLLRETVNALMYSLDAFEKADPKNRITVYANKIRDKIYNHGRTYTYKGEEKVVIYFYEQEAALLIKLMSFFISATDNPKQDFYFSIGKRRKQ